MRQHVKTIMLRLVITLSFCGSGLVQFNMQKSLFLKAAKWQMILPKMLLKIASMEKHLLQVDLAATTPGTET